MTNQNHMIMWVYFSLKGGKTAGIRMEEKANGDILYRRCEKSILLLGLLFAIEPQYHSFPFNKTGRLWKEKKKKSHVWTALVEQNRE